MNVSESSQKHFNYITTTLVINLTDINLSFNWNATG